MVAGGPAQTCVVRSLATPGSLLACRRSRARLVAGKRLAVCNDEPLLHTMYVDKPLSGIKAVQTLSRLNRAHPQKHDCFVLDFQNNSEAITFAFQDHFRTTLLAEETDPNKLHDLKSALDTAQVYAPEQVQQVVALFLGGAERDKLDPILDACVATYLTRLDEDGQVDFKGKAKVFSRIGRCRHVGGNRGVSLRAEMTFLS